MGVTYSINISLFPTIIGHCPPVATCFSGSEVSSDDDKEMSANILLSLLGLSCRSGSSPENKVVCLSCASMDSSVLTVVVPALCSSNDIASSSSSLCHLVFGLGSSSVKNLPKATNFLVISDDSSTVELFAPVDSGLDCNRLVNAGFRMPEKLPLTDLENLVKLPPSSLPLLTSVETVSLMPLPSVGLDSSPFSRSSDMLSPNDLVSLLNFHPSVWGVEGISFFGSSILHEASVDFWTLNFWENLIFFVKLDIDVLLVASLVLDTFDGLSSFSSSSGMECVVVLFPREETFRRLEKENLLPVLSVDADLCSVEC